MNNKINENKLLENTAKKDEFVKNFLETNLNKLYIDSSDSTEFLPSQANLVCANDNLDNALIELVYHLHRSVVYKILVDKNIKTIAEKYKYASLDNDAILSLVYETIQNNPDKEDPKKDLVSYEFKQVKNGEVKSIAKGTTPSKYELQLTGFAISDDKAESYKKHYADIDNKELSDNFNQVAKFALTSRNESSKNEQPSNN